MDNGITTKDIWDWLESERWLEEDGRPESLLKTLNRKLKKLMALEQQGH